MDLVDQFRLLVGGYYGILEMDEYDLKVYILKDIENYIRDFISNNPISDFDYLKEKEIIEDTLPLKRKLQDSLIVLNKIDVSIDLILLVKKRLKAINEIEHSIF